MARHKKTEPIRNIIISNGILPEPSFLKSEPVFDRRQWGTQEEAGRFSDDEAVKILRKAKRIYHDPKAIRVDA